jgi:hypothetical protein
LKSNCTFLTEVCFNYDIEKQFDNIEKNPHQNWIKNKILLYLSSIPKITTTPNIKTDENLHPFKVKSVSRGHIWEKVKVVF